MTTAAPTPDARASLAAKLDEISLEADILREGAEPPGPDDLAAMVDGASLVEQFLGEVVEIVRQICVAGLAFPAPELPSALEQLAERAAALRLPTAYETLGRLRHRLAAVLAEPALDKRPALSADAWEETQRLIAWMRLFRREHDLVAVQSRMAAEARGEGAPPAAAAAALPARSMSVWPLGIDLAPGGKLLIFCRDTESDAVAVLVDHLAEYRPDDPLAGKAISRLFQEALSLGPLLKGLIRLEDHPVTERGGVVFFRPAFGATPKARPVARSFVPPALPELTVSPSAPVPRGPGRLKAQIGWAPGRLDVTVEGLPVPLAVPPLLRFNLAKLLLREATRALPLDLVVVGRGDELRVLSAETDFDGRTFPAHDPSLFVLSREVLRARLARARPGDPLALASAQAAAFSLGGAGDDELEAFRARLADLAPRGLLAHYRWALAGARVGAELPPARVRPLLDDALALLAPGADADPARLSRVLGRDGASSADARLLEGAAYPVVWLAMEANLVDALRPGLTALLEGRLASVDAASPASDVCAKALLTALLGAPLVGGTATAAPGAAFATDEDDDEGDEAEAADGGALGRAIALLQGLIASLTPGPGGGPARPLPDPLELVQLGDTLAFLHGHNRLRGTLVPLALPAELTRQRAADALLGSPAGGGEDGPAALYAAADALLALAAAGQAPLLVS
ncbi:MAG TPA: hypothetical protein VFS43_10715 [Polyangiaceae bacterium]|nr:hypothetical protein [Polyangiaceae bacterium]